MGLRNEAITRAGEEGGERLGIAEQVDVALAIPLLDIGQAMPFFRRREQALGQKRQPLREDGQLTGPGVAEASVDSDQVSQVKQFDEAPAFVADLFLANEDLDAFGPVAQVEEVDLPLAAAKHDPPRNPNDRSRGLTPRLSRRNR